MPKTPLLDAHSTQTRYDVICYFTPIIFSAHCTFFMSRWPVLRRGGGCLHIRSTISSWNYVFHHSSYFRLNVFFLTGQYMHIRMLINIYLCIYIYIYINVYTDGYLYHVLWYYLLSCLHDMVFVYSFCANLISFFFQLFVAKFIILYLQVIY